MHSLLKERKGFGGNSMQKVLNAIQRVRFTKSTPRHASIRDKKGPSLGKIQVKHPHQRSHHAIKFEDRSHEETERPERCAGLGSCQKYVHVQRERQNYTLLARGRMGTSSCLSKRAGGERVCGGFRTLTLLSWRPRGHREVRRR